MPSQTSSIQPVINQNPTPVFQIGQVEAFVAVAVVLVGLGVSWGTLSTKIGHIASSIKDKIEPDLKDVRERFATLEGSLGKTFASASPVKLLPKGEQIIVESGLKNYIDENQKTLLEKFKFACVTKNQYDIQDQAFKFFDELDFGIFEDKLKKAAFDHGMNIATIRRIGGIYFRDIALLEAGFKPEDLDSPKQV